MRATASTVPASAWSSASRILTSRPFKQWVAAERACGRQVFWLKDGNFMIDTPGEPKRLERFQALARKYGWTKGQFVTLVPRPSASGAMPD
jgi:hypothetical protein